VNGLLKLIYILNLRMNFGYGDFVND